MVMVFDFTLVYALDPGRDAQDELRRPAGSDCTDATMDWGRPRYIALAFSRAFIFNA